VSIRGRALRQVAYPPRSPVKVLGTLAWNEDRDERQSGPLPYRANAVGTERG